MNQVHPSFWKEKRVFVTGHTGFKGMWLCRMLAFLGARVEGYSLGVPTPEGEALYHLPGMRSCQREIMGDVRNLNALQTSMGDWRPEIVFHLAAQPIVAEGYRAPVETYSTNVMGTVNLLECVRHVDSVGSVLNVTTDKVYRNREWAWGYREHDALGGTDPYANSKTCSEFVSCCYRQCFLTDGRAALSTVRAGNVIGGGDFSMYRIVPDCIRAAMGKRPIEVRNPNSIRPYQHVLDPVYAYLMIAEAQFKDGEHAGSYNVGPSEEDCVTTGRLASLFSELWGEGQTWKTVKADAMPPESRTLRLDCSRLRDVFGWSPRWKVREALDRTIEWTRVYVSHGNVAACMDRQIEAFLSGGERV